MVDARQLMSFKRFIESNSDKTIIYSTEFGESLNIYSNGKSVTKVEVQYGVHIKSASSIGFYALYGIINLKHSSYVMLVTRANIAGQILQRKILQVEELSFLPLIPNARLNDVHNEDRLFVDMIQSIVSTKTLFFSYEYDLTQSFDRMMANNSQSVTQQHTAENLCYYKVPNERFAYNWAHVKFMNELSASAMQYWQTIFISGCVMIKYCRLTQNADCNFILISRRETTRSGKRYTQRGCDDYGNCTNFAETEQIIILDHKESYCVYSFVQTRGSMPFSWKSPATLKWSPKAYIQGDKSYNVELIKKHFEQQTKVYPQQILINLIDKKGTQKMLGEYFTQLVSALQNTKIRYVWFDFHHECRKMRYDNLKKLVNEIKEEVKKGGYFMGEVPKGNVNQLSSVQLKQTGVARTNCMDCLDRTNVVQSVIARYILLQILNEAKIVPTLTGEAFQPLPNDLERIFRNLWTRNADVMSIMYTGTGALKTDFTKTGKRTFMGSLQDGKNSIQRYFINNFKDGHNQNCIDLMLGKLDVTKTNYKKRKLSGISLFVFLLVLISVVAVSCLKGYVVSEDSHFITTSVTTLTILAVSMMMSLKLFGKMSSVFIQQPILDQQ